MIQLVLLRGTGVALEAACVARVAVEGDLSQPHVDVDVDVDLADLLRKEMPAGERCVIELTNGKRVRAAARASRASVDVQRLQRVPSILEGLRTIIGAVALLRDDDDELWLILRIL